MNILVVGNPESHAEFKSKFGSKHLARFKTCQEMTHEDVQEVKIIFDFQIFDQPQHGEIYHRNPGALLVLNSVKTTLAELVRSNSWKHSVLGFNGLPGMFNKPILELTTYHGNQSKAEALCNRLDTKYRIVEDRVGMVTPRVLCMIINEAFYTVQEGTARQQDIDLAMKLGTNYPAGPFEMAELIGLDNIYELLLCLHRVTGEERYKVSPLMKKRLSDLI